MTQWIDLENDPAPQWVGDMAVAESGYRAPYEIGGYFHFGESFKALCRRIFRTEKPPVDPDFERMTLAIAAYETCGGRMATAKSVRDGYYPKDIQAALDAWNETVAS